MIVKDQGGDLLGSNERAKTRPSFESKVLTLQCTHTGKGKTGSNDVLEARDVHVVYWLLFVGRVGSTKVLIVKRLSESKDAKRL